MQVRRFFGFTVTYDWFAGFMPFRVSQGAPLRGCVAVSSMWKSSWCSFFCDFLLDRQVLAWVSAGATGYVHSDYSSKRTWLVIFSTTETNAGTPVLTFFLVCCDPGWWWVTTSTGKCRHALQPI